ncbi:MAG: hypothetical protein ACYC51_07660 [Thermoleophilia bacterium]
MFNRAKKILASELMYARNIDETAADKFLDGVLKEMDPAAVAKKMDDSP